MEARLARAYEEDAVVELARRYAEAASQVGFDPAVVRTTFRGYIFTAHPTIYVAADSDGLAGLLTCSLHAYTFTTGLFTIQDVLFVLPEKRGSRAAAHLLRAFDQWSDAVGAKEVFYGTSTGRKADSFARFVARTTGAKLAGNVLKRVRE